MGLLDILNGMQKGPRGQGQAGSGARGGMSPMTMALLGVLAYKAVKSFAGAGAGEAAQPPTGTPASSGGAGAGLTEALGRILGGSGGGGAVDDTLPGALASLLGGAATGSMVSGGLGTLVREFEEKGYGRAVQSWIGKGANEGIAPDDVANALGSDTLDALSRHTGMNRADLLAALSQHLPDLIDQLTPKGRLPTNEEASRLA
jgi:uncharacterized protein YidB (DUF937 family)